MVLPAVKAILELCAVCQVLYDFHGNPIAPYETIKSEMFLVKWMGLSYYYCTWEYAENINDDMAIARFRRFNRPPMQSLSVRSARVVVVVVGGEGRCSQCALVATDVDRGEEEAVLCHVPKVQGQQQTARLPSHCAQLDRQQLLPPAQLHSG